MLGISGDQYDGVADDDGFKKGGYNSQLSVDTPWKFIGTSQITEDPPGGVNPDGRSSGNFYSSVSARNSCRGVATRRYPIPFETGDKREEPKSI